ncbi:DNA-directed RNA polymerase subunit omega [Solibaculum mannosilyticum]|uniref:DNA-directed RNA polymerase subunit omega n=1 Tax=Solibaculum mannosilyticum TaxID=2780922 RepID=UPI0007A8B482|nr:DNA-directed RNA polymerase subunit omega [Eubacteriaceae bacterium CHKCI005]
MLKTGIADLKTDESYYALVMAIAKRARNIAEKAEREEIPLTEKPVSLALEELREGHLLITHPQHEDGEDSMQ